MKKLIFISLAIFVMFAISCTDDYTDPAKLSGTTWRCSNFPTEEITQVLEYEELHFTSTTKVDIFIKMKGETAQQGDDSMTYSIKDNKITFVSSNNDSKTGTIEKTTITVVDGGYSLAFVKQ